MESEAANEEEMDVDDEGNEPVRAQAFCGALQYGGAPSIHEITNSNHVGRGSACFSHLPFPEPNPRKEAGEMEGGRGSAHSETSGDG